MQRFSAVALLIPLCVSCGQKNSDHSTSIKSEWDRANAPERIGLKSSSYQPNLAKLPNTGRLATRPWSGSYWPTFQGGITYRWNHSSRSLKARIFYPIIAMEELKDPDEIRLLSPAEKYDLLIARPDYPVTNFERNRTEILRTRSEPDFKIPRWEGLCHAWAPATHLFDNPAPVTMTNPEGIEIPFGSSDVKALLTYFLHVEDEMTFFVSRRCNIKDEELRQQLRRGEINSAEYLRQMESARCEGVNAGAFHIILANMIGLQQKAFIADVTRDYEVWNQAVHAYETAPVQQSRDIHPDAAPGTTREILMKTRMFYTVEIHTSWKRVETKNSESYLDYAYWLELDRYDNIIGGRWESHERPDFIWSQAKPEFNGIWTHLADLYKASVADLNQEEAGEDDGRIVGQFRDVNIKIKKGLFRSKFKVRGKVPRTAASATVEYRLTNGKTVVHKQLDIADDFSFKGKFYLYFMKAGTIVLKAFDSEGYQVGAKKIEIAKE